MYKYIALALIIFTTQVSGVEVTADWKAVTKVNCDMLNPDIKVSDCNVSLFCSINKEAYKKIATVNATKNTLKFNATYGTPVSCKLRLKRTTDNTRSKYTKVVDLLWGPSTPSGFTLKLN